LNTNATKIEKVAQTFFVSIDCGLEKRKKEIYSYCTFSPEE
jgi:hypothetical protein